MSSQVPAHALKNARLETRQPPANGEKLSGLHIVPAGASASTSPDARQIVPSNRSLVIRLQVAILDSPDHIHIESAKPTEEGFEFVLTHRDFEGDLAANVQSAAFLVAETSALVPGDYTFVVRTHVYGFRSLGRPDLAEARPARFQVFSFTVIDPDIVSGP